MKATDIWNIRPLARPEAVVRGKEPVRDGKAVRPGQTDDPDGGYLRAGSDGGNRI